MRLVEDVYALCTAQPKSLSETLYYTLRDFLLEHVKNLAANLASYDGDVLGEYRRRWAEYQKGIQIVHMIFRYLNLHWIKKTLEDGRNRLGGLFQSDGGNHKDVYEIYTLGLLIWKEQVFDTLGSRVIARILEEVLLDRKGEEVNVAVCAQAIESFVDIGKINKGKPLQLYQDEFESRYVQNTRDFYRIESLQFIDNNGISEYMKKAEARVAEEELRSKRFLNKASLDFVRKEVDIVLIDAHRELLQVECRQYLERTTTAVNGKEVADVSDLRRMFSLLSRVPNGVDPMLNVLRAYVVQYVSDKIQALGKKAELPEEYCEVLIDAYGLFSVTIVEGAFQNSPKFVQTMDKALREVINQQRSSPELMARYCDSLLRKGKNKSEGDALDLKLKALVTVFKYLDDKDIFQRFYSKYLARRLIYGTSVSDDSEADVLSNLKQACGFEYTIKMQRMFSDMALCEDVNNKFQDFLKAENCAVSVKPVNFSVFVLTQGSWPLQVHKSAFNPPPVMRRCLDAFAAFYDSAHQGRRLAWLHHLGKADIRVNCFKSTYSLTVTDFQCGVLTLFNDRDDKPIAWEEISAEIAMSDSELANTMASLVSSKLILRQVGSEDGVGTVYDVNKKFSSKHRKLKITSAAQAETEKDKKKTYKAVDEDRSMFLQALIVRIMKARKQLNHNQLIQLAIEHARARFQPEISTIKKSIDILIDKVMLFRRRPNT